MNEFFILIFLLPFAVFSQLQVAKIFSDKMILQRDEPVHIWGKAIPGQKVNASFAKENKSSAVQADSSWNIFFGKQKATLQPASLIISSGKDKIKLNNILIGDIWMCIGQLNMELIIITSLNI